MNELRLDELAIIRKEEDEDSVIYYVEPSEEPSRCPICFSSNIVLNGKRDRWIHDLPTFGKTAKLFLTYHRLLCKSCGHSFTANIYCVDAREKLTKRLRDAIQKDSLNHTFSDVSLKYSVSIPTVKRIFDEYAERESRTFVLKAPRVLGIDEVHLNNNMRCVFADIESRGILDILKKRDKDSVRTWLENLPDHKSIGIVTMDMWKPYADAVKDVLPSATIVVDKFHVLRLVTDAMESVRKGVSKSLSKGARISLKNSRWLMLHNREDLDGTQEYKLEYILSAFPDLELAYRLKEAFRDIYDAKSRREAEALYEQWKSYASLVEFDAVIKTVENWRDEIFNYFDCKYTNGVVEALNGVIKSIQRAGRGYSFDVLRAKLLYSTKATKKPIYKKKPISYEKNFEMRKISEISMNFHTPFMSTEKQEIEAGAFVEITELQKLIDSGLFDIP